MAISENDGLLGEKEYSAFKERSIRLKFTSQLFTALGGATFFGLLSSVATSLMTGGLITIALIPTAVLSIVGVCCIYAAQRFFFESQTLDQDFNAKKIAAATTKAQAMGIEQSHHEPARTNTFPGMNLRDQHEHSDDAHHATNWADKHPKRGHPEKHADAHRATAPADTWAEELHANEQSAQPGHRVH